MKKDNAKVEENQKAATALKKHADHRSANFVIQSGAGAHLQTPRGVGPGKSDAGGKGAKKGGKLRVPHNRCILLRDIAKKAVTMIKPRVLPCNKEDK